ncbi:MAG: chorismate mutase [Methanomicrobiales archaeon]|jgi:chorismate mutase|nr:chorismate mutase [Methanomicrobiales archaeon]
MTLDAVREEIHGIDNQIIDLIVERQKLAAKIARIKQEEDRPIQDGSQQKTVLGRAFTYAVEKRVDPVAVRRIFEILIDMSEEWQRECNADSNLPWEKS